MRRMQKNNLVANQESNQARSYYKRSLSVKFDRIIVNERDLKYW